MSHGEPTTISVAPLGTGDFVEAPLIREGFDLGRDDWHHEGESSAVDVRKTHSVTFSIGGDLSGLRDFVDESIRQRAQELAHTTAMTVEQAEAQIRKLMAAAELRTARERPQYTPNRATRRKQEREARRDRRG